MAYKFEITKSAIKSRIAGVQQVQGQVYVYVDVMDPELGTAKLVLARYSVDSGNTWFDADLDSSGWGKNQIVETGVRWKRHIIKWNAYKDLEMERYENVMFKIQVQDAAEQNDDEQISSAFIVDLKPKVQNIICPKSYTADESPKFQFIIPESYFTPCDMHFQIKLSECEDMSNPIVIDSSADQTGWKFEFEGVQHNLDENGVSNLCIGEKCEYEGYELSEGKTYYFEIEVYAEKWTVQTTEWAIESQNINVRSINM